MEQDVTIWGDNEIKTPQPAGHTAVKVEGGHYAQGCFIKFLRAPCDTAETTRYTQVSEKLPSYYGERCMHCILTAWGTAITGFWVIIGYFTALLLLTSIYDDEWSGNEWWIRTDLERETRPSSPANTNSKPRKASIMIINNICDMWPGYFTIIVPWLCSCITAFSASCKR